MGMDEHNDDSCSEVIKGLDPHCGEYDKILDILDFPLESVEGDDKDWDASNYQDLGPIPLDDFMGFYQTHNVNESVNKAPRHNRNTLTSTESEKKEQVDCVDIVHRNGALPIVISPEISAFQTPSPISVLEGSGACSSGKSLPIGLETVIPVRARSKRGRPANVNTWFQKTPIACAVANKSSNSIKVKKRRRMSELNHTENKATSMQRSVGTNKCTHCHSTQTPQWREGPLGKNTLCNACGVRYRSGRLFPEYRPAASPTFTPSVHSNSHRKVIEMRKKAIQEEAVLVENPMSSLAEFVPMSSYLLDDSMLKK